MSLPSRYAVRGVVVLVVLIAVASVAGSFTAVRSPYLSALSDLASVGDAQASPTCTDRVCDPSGAVRCVHQNGSHTDCARGDFCRERACP